MSKKNILVVDDEEKIRKVIKIYLQKEGYEVEEAGKGKEALEKFKYQDYSLVILDVMMPEIDGWIVCRQMRKNSAVPIIMLTARSEEYDKLFGFELGVDDYITKPFSPREVVARVNAVIRRSENISKQKISAGQISINLEAKEVFIDNEEIMLTPKEFDLLYFLLSNPQKAFSREVILNKIWGYNYYGDLRTVDTHVKQLRSKLGKYKKYIYTVWGMGYMFKVGEDNENQQN